MSRRNPVEEPLDASCTHLSAHPLRGKIVIVKNQGIDDRPDAEIAYRVIDWIDRVERDHPLGDTLQVEYLYHSRIECLRLPKTDDIVLLVEIGGKSLAAASQSEIVCHQHHPDFRRLYASNPLISAEEIEVGK